MLFGIPISILTTLGGSIMGFVTKLFAMRMEMNAAKEKHTIEALTAKQGLRNADVENEIRLLEARTKFEQGISQSDPHFSWTRRWLTFAIVAIAGLIIPGVVVFGDVTWFHVVEYTKTTGFWIFSNETEVAEIVTSKGLPFIFATEFLAFVGGVVGFYFGQSAAKMKNPYVK